VGHGGGYDAEVLLCHGHPGVEEVFGVEVEGGADGLGYEDAGVVSMVNLLVRLGGTHAMMLPLK